MLDGILRREDIMLLQCTLWVFLLFVQEWSSAWYPGTSCLVMIADWSVCMNKGAQSLAQQVRNFLFVSQTPKRIELSGLFQTIYNLILEIYSNQR